MSLLCGLKFQISATSFFQVNHGAAELLYEGVRDWVGLTNPSSTSVLNDAESQQQTKKQKMILDLCCGTGTIGQILATSVEKPQVIGVEMVESAVEDAKLNAQLNGIENVDYICDKVENAMRVVMKRVYGDRQNDTQLNKNETDSQSMHTETCDMEVVAVLDPPRSGVHNSVVRALREAEEIKKIIYVCCDFGNGNVIANFVEYVFSSSLGIFLKKYSLSMSTRKDTVLILIYRDSFCRPASNRYKGAAFRISRMQPFDLFPSTKHCEIMVELLRD